MSDSRPPQPPRTETTRSDTPRAGSSRPASDRPGALSVGRKTRPADLSSFVFGKLPPQARELEEAVLGAMLIDRDAVTAVIDVLQPESFYLDAHRQIYEAVHDLFEKSQPVDILTVTEELRLKGELESVGGAYFVASLSSKVTSAANVEHHARIVAQKFIQRELIRISTSIIQDAYEDTTDVLELLDRSERDLFSVGERNLRRSYDDMRTLVSRAIKEIDEARRHEDSLTGIPSGFTGLDRITSGWQRSDLIVVAARPGMGKTAFTLSLARNAAVEFGIPVAVFSLEMSSTQLVKRLISMETELTGDKIRRGNLAEHEWIQLTKLTGRLADAPIYIDDTPAINIFELRAKCRRLAMEHGVKLIVIDYLQLMSGTPNSNAGNREQEISNISRSLKSIAKELDVPVISLSQLSRAVETRGGHRRPQLSDLRESGAIEQDADIVTFLYRPEYYGFNEDEDGHPSAGMADIMIAKHRNGALDNVRVRFIDKFAKFAELEGYEYGGGELPSQGKFSPLSDHVEEPPSGVIKRPSRMDEDADDGDVPF